MKSNSYYRTRNRFATSSAAQKYAGRSRGTWRDRREQRCVVQSLQSLPLGSSVLDIACGTGRLVPALVSRGFVVTAADSSEHMIAQAIEAWNRDCEFSTLPQEMARFEVMDVMKTSYEDRQFDAVVCNRLFHHFDEAAVRLQALRELKRICNRLIVVSFYSCYSFGAIRRRLRNAIKGNSYRAGMPKAKFVEEARQIGLTPVRFIPLRLGISPQCYLTLQPTETQPQTLR